MNFYTKTRSGNKVVISILGIKIKYKIKENSFLNNMFQEWQTGFQPQLLEQKLRTITQCNIAQKEENKEIFLIFISTLLENNKIDEAKKILHLYLSKYKTELISSYPLVANLTDELGLGNEDIKKTAQIWRTLENNRLNSSLEKYLQNKSIAVIGNSPNLIGQNKGSQIDNADVVVRFNNYATTNYETDYGHKTNIWVFCQAGDIIERPLTEISTLDHILCNIDLKHIKLRLQSRDLIYKYLSAPLPISYIGAEHKKDLQQYGIIYPSSGLSALYHLKNISSITRNNIFGFSFLENNQNYYDHYFQKRSAAKIKKFAQNGHHNFELENTVLQQIFEDK